MSADEHLAVGHMLDAGQAILEWTKAGKRAFLGNRMMRDAVFRNFEVMGEAAKRLPASFREAHPEVPWSGIARFRDALIHGYDRIDQDQVWKTVTGPLPDAVRALRKLHKATK